MDDACRRALKQLKIAEAIANSMVRTTQTLMDLGPAPTPEARARVLSEQLAETRRLALEIYAYATDTTMDLEEEIPWPPDPSPPPPSRP